MQTQREALWQAATAPSRIGVRQQQGEVQRARAPVLLKTRQRWVQGKGLQLARPVAVQVLQQGEAAGVRQPARTAAP